MWVLRVGRERKGFFVSYHLDTPRPAMRGRVPFSFNLFLGHGCWYGRYTLLV